MTQPAYRGCEFLAAVTDLQPRLRRQAVARIEPEDFTTEPYRVIFAALTSMSDFETVIGRANTIVSLRDHLVETGALAGELAFAISEALKDISGNDAYGAQAFIIGPRLREDRFRSAMKAFSRKLGDAADSAPKDGIDAILADNLGELRRLSMRCQNTAHEPHLKAVG